MFYSFCMWRRFKYVLLFVCFSGLDVFIVGFRRWGTYYINVGAGPNITRISNLNLSLDQLIHHMSYAPFQEVHIVLYYYYYYDYYYCYHTDSIIFNIINWILLIHLYYQIYQTAMSLTQSVKNMIRLFTTILDNHICHMLQLWRIGSG